MEKERRDKEERDRLEAERLETERREAERRESERREAERREAERKAEHERREQERRDREEAERRAAAEEKERKEKEERERKLQAEQRERERLEIERKTRDDVDKIKHESIEKAHKRRFSSPESADSITHEDKKPKSENSRHRRLSKDVAKSDKHNPNKHMKKDEKSSENDRRCSIDDRNKKSDNSSRSDFRSDRDKHRNKNKNRDGVMSQSTPNKDKENSHENSIDKTFFDAIELRSSGEEERLRSIAKKEAKEKKELERAKELHDGAKTCSGGDSGDSRTNDHDSKSKDKQDYERKSSRQGDDSSMGNYSSNRSRRGKSSRRNATGNSSEDNSSENERKKHSIFDIPDDGPAYISMYDKVKARSCKNMQKQEEEKKIRAKFSKLKRSRAKRENKKRSTSWDEDSDSDDDEPRYNRVNHKALVSSSDDDGKQKMYDSDDKFNHRRLHDNLEGESSENSAPHQKPRRKISSRKNSRSTRIASSDSDEDVKVKQEVKLEMISDDDDYKHTPVKQEKHPSEIKQEIKKEMDTYKFSAQVCDISSDGDALKTPISAPALLDSKSSFEHLFGSAASAHDSKKKHKKNKKRQKSFPLDSTDEDMLPLTERRDSLKTDFDELKRQESHERRKHGSKKEKKREKNREEHERISKEERKKIRKQRGGKQNDKREEKMENIFGPLSDDETRHSMDQKSSMSCSTAFDQLLAKTEAENRKNEEIKEAALAKEESKKKKDRRRREKNRSYTAKDDENSVDLDEAGRALEAQLLMNDSEPAKHDQESTNTNKTDDVFRFSDGDDDGGKKEDSHRREKKKKRKRSKEEKSHKHHHHKQQQSSGAQETDPSPSLPCLVDDSSSQPTNKTIPVRGNGMTSPPPSMDSKPATSSPVKKPERKSEIFIPGFGGKIDEKIHESAVLSIAQELEASRKDEKVVHEVKPAPVEPVEQPKIDAKAAEEKSRVVISQEETEDAVAALLGKLQNFSIKPDIKLSKLPFILFHRRKLWHK